jgi:hypothetical protein
MMVGSSSTSRPMKPPSSAPSRNSSPASICFHPSSGPQRAEDLLAFFLADALPSLRPSGQRARPQLSLGAAMGAMRHRSAGAAPAPCRPASEARCQRAPPRPGSAGAAPPNTRAHAAPRPVPAPRRAAPTCRRPPSRPIAGARSLLPVPLRLAPLSLCGGRARVLLRPSRLPVPGGARDGTVLAALHSARRALLIAIPATAKGRPTAQTARTHTPAQA